MKDALLDLDELAPLAEWLDMSPDTVRQKIDELAVERRGRRPGGPGGWPRKRE